MKKKEFHKEEKRYKQGNERNCKNKNKTKKNKQTKIQKQKQKREQEKINEGYSQIYDSVWGNKNVRKRQWFIFELFIYLKINS